MLNGVALDATPGAAKACEVDLALGHLPHTRPGDLILADRNCPPYRYLAALRREGATSSAAARRRRSPPPAPCCATGGQTAKRPPSLADEALHPPAFFLEVCHLCWGVEGFYGRLKTRLDRENFTGQSAESMRQDFHSTVYLAGLESLLTQDANARLAEKNARLDCRANHAVAFNAIKNRALDLLDREADLDALAERLTALFLMNPTSARPERKPPRAKRSLSHQLDYQRRRKKYCF